MTSTRRRASSKPSVIELLRHAESECNVAGRLCGRDCDVGLTESGHSMARALAETLSPGAYRRIVTSPLRRAVATAEPLASALSLPLVIDPRLSEIAYGAWEGQTPAALGEALSRFHADPEAYPPPGGERPSEVLARVLPAVSSSESTLFVGHKTTWRILIAHLTGAPIARYRDIPQPPGCLTSIENRGQ